MNSLAKRIANRYMEAGTTPVPESFPYNEIGLMTRTEFLEYQNERNKFHSSDAYNWTFAKMNEDWSLRYLASLKTSKGYDFKFEGVKGKGVLIKEDGKLVAVVHKGTMYHLNKIHKDNLPTGYWDDMGRGDRVDLGVKRYKLVKYLTEAKALVSDLVKYNLSQYPNLVQRVKSRGEFYEIRSEGPLQKDKGVSMAIFNDDGYVVAKAQDEWNAALLVVAQEYRGKGLGHILGKVWFKVNPEYRSGGFTAEGEGAALKIWEARVREFLANGWYTDLLHQDRITVKRVKEIVGRVPKKKRYPETPTKQKGKKKLLVYAQDWTFAIYDEAFYDVPNHDYDSLKDMIYAYGFFRESPHVGSYLYTIDYDPKFRELATLVALQMAKDNGERVYNGEGYTDILELDGIKGVVKDGDYIELEKDVLPLRALASKEKTHRRKKDKYQERYHLLLEMGEAKWK